MLDQHKDITFPFFSHRLRLSTFFFLRYLALGQIGWSVSVDITFQVLPQLNVSLVWTLTEPFYCIHV